MIFFVDEIEHISLSINLDKVKSFVETFFLRDLEGSLKASQLKI